MGNSLKTVFAVSLIFLMIGCSTIDEIDQTKDLSRSTSLSQASPPVPSIPRDTKIPDLPTETVQNTIHPSTITPTRVRLSANGQIAMIQAGQNVNGVILFTFKPDGTYSKENLTEGFDTVQFYFQPAWSPDGSQILFVNGRENTDIYSMNLKDRGVKKITSGGCRLNLDPTWSQDGKWIAITRCGEIFVMDPNGNQHRQLTDTEGFESNLSWSPDGSQIAFLYPKEKSDDLDIFILDLLENQRTRVPLAIPAGWSQISWSPDGEWLAYRSSEGCGDICVARKDGSENHCLTDTFFGEKDPSWSPDGKFIAYVATKTGLYCTQKGGESLMAGWQLRVLEIDILQAIPIYEVDGIDYWSPVWRPKNPDNEQE